MKIIKSLFFAFLLISLVSGCNEEEEKKTDLQVLDVKVEKQGEWVDTSPYFKIVFNQDIVEESVNENSVVLSDANHSLANVSYQVHEDRLYIYCNETLAFDADYTLTITKSLKSLQDHHLPKNYSVSFTTGPKPHTAQELGRLDIFGSIYAVEVQGNYAFVLDRSNGVIVYSINNLTNPIEVSRLTLPLSGSNSAKAMMIQNSYAYILTSREGMKIVDISDPNELKMVNDYQFINQHGTSTLSDFSSGMFIDDSQRLFVFDSFFDGFDMLDISDPVSPQLIGSFRSETLDFVTGGAVKGDYVYLIDHSGEIEIVDITNPAQPISARIYSGELNYLTTVTIKGEYLLVNSTVFDISDPVNLVPVTTLSASSIDMAGDIACFSHYPNGLSLVDVSDPVSPSVLSSIDINDTYGCTIDGNNLFLYGSRKLAILDISDPTDPKSLSQYVDSNDAFVNLAVRGDYAYMQEHGNKMQIFDISDPGNITFVRTWEVDERIISDLYYSSVFLDGNYAYVRSYAEDTDISIYDITDVSNITQIGTIDFPGYVTKFVISGQYAYIFQGFNEISIFDISDITTPLLINTITPDLEYIGDFAVNGDYVYVRSMGGSTLKVFDISDMKNPVEVGSIEIRGTSQYKDTLFFGTDKLYIYYGSYEEISVFDISNPSQPVREKGFDGDMMDSYSRVFIYDDKAYMVEHSRGLAIFDLSEE